MQSDAETGTVWGGVLHYLVRVITFGTCFGVPDLLLPWHAYPFLRDPEAWGTTSSVKGLNRLWGAYPFLRWCRRVENSGAYPFLRSPGAFHIERAYPFLRERDGWCREIRKVLG